MYDTLFVHLFQVVFSSSPRPMIPASNADEARAARMLLLDGKVVVPMNHPKSTISII